MPTPAKDAVTADGQFRQLSRVICEPRGRVERAAVEVEITGWFSRDPAINVLDFRAKARGIEVDGARNWHRRNLRLSVQFVQ